MEDEFLAFKRPTQMRLGQQLDDALLRFFNFTRGRRFKREILRVAGGPRVAVKNQESKNSPKELIRAQKGNKDEEKKIQLTASGPS
ncbi:hypothetical protein Tco_0943652 [Tanacetum coccineum]